MKSLLTLLLILALSSPALGQQLNLYPLPKDRPAEADEPPSYTQGIPPRPGPDPRYVSKELFEKAMRERNGQMHEIIRLLRKIARE